jgi:hypothetical protein
MDKLSDVVREGPKEGIALSTVRKPFCMPRLHNDLKPQAPRTEDITNGRAETVERLPNSGVPSAHVIADSQGSHFHADLGSVRAQPEVRRFAFRFNAYTSELALVAQALRELPHGRHLASGISQFFEDVVRVHVIRTTFRGECAIDA